MLAHGSGRARGFLGGMRRRRSRARDARGGDSRREGLFDYERGCADGASRTDGEGGGGQHADSRALGRPLRVGRNPRRHGGGVASGNADDAEAPQLVARLQTACASETQSLSSRTFGGPHGVVWAEAPPVAAEDCLERPHRTIAELMDAVLSARNECLASESCDAAALEMEELALRGAALAEIRESCDHLAFFIAIEPDEYVRRTLAQLDCLTAVAHDDVDPLSLSCGPGAVERDPPPAPEASGYMKVVLDSEVYGTGCGGDEPHYPSDNPYAFYIKPAPEGYPVENVLIQLEGGGACVFDAEEPLPGHAGCYTRYLEDPTLFEAQTTPDTLGIGIMSDDPTVSPFANWTKVFLQYCTQDLHMGDGVTNYFANYDFTVHRFGAHNLRAALGYVRDLVWKTLDEQGGEGYRPDLLKVAFAGFSAGGIGSLYNYHWVLDDLQWPHTAAIPDSALVLDNTHNDFWNYRTLSSLVLPHEGPYGWGAVANQPPYCFGPDCTILPVLLKAHDPRLGAVPEQQYMLISNQNDEVMMRSTFFDRETTYEQGRVNFINAGRQAYCETRDLDFVNWYFMPFPESLHSTSLEPYFLNTVSVGNQTMMSWMGDVFSSPEGVANRVEEGDLSYYYPGVDFFPCELPPPFDPCEGVDCDDANACTSDYCDSFSGTCRNPPMYDGAYCDFGELPGLCIDGTCLQDLCTGDPCNDQNRCTSDRCEPADGSCTHQPVFDGAYCDFDGLPGRCAGGVCERDFCAFDPCNDQNECTFDMCSPEDGSCSYENRPDGTPCLDALGECAGGECVPLPVCGEGRSISEMALSDEQILLCSVLVAEFPLRLPVTLAVTPLSEVQAGAKDVEVQAELGFSVSTVNNAFLAGVRVLRIGSAVVSVAPTLGSSEPTPASIEESTQPCVVVLEYNTPASFVLPTTQASWVLDEGLTLELSVVDVEKSFETTGLSVELRTAGPGANCVWESEAPSVELAEP